MKPKTPRVPAAKYVQLMGDPAALERYVAEKERAEREREPVHAAAERAIAEGRLPRTAPARKPTVRPASTYEMDPDVSGRPTLEMVQSHPSVPKVAHTRGPWLLSIERLGRPMTFNAERTSAMSKGTTFKVRAAERSWSEAVSDAAVQAGIPLLAAIFPVFQPYYPTNVVPDPDALPGAIKAGLDGLVRAGVVPDDRRAQLPLGYHVLPPITDGGPARLTITVYPLPD